MKKVTWNGLELELTGEGLEHLPDHFTGDLHQLSDGELEGVSGGTTENTSGEMWQWVCNTCNAKSGWYPVKAGALMNYDFLESMERHSINFNHGSFTTNTKPM